MQTVQLYLAEEKSYCRAIKKKNNEFFQQQKNINKYESFLTAFKEGISLICILVVLWYAAHLSIRHPYHKLWSTSKVSSLDYFKVNLFLIGALHKSKVASFILKQFLMCASFCNSAIF